MDPLGGKAEIKWTESTRGKMKKSKWNTVEGAHFIATRKFTVQSLKDGTPPFWILSNS